MAVPKHKHSKSRSRQRVAQWQGVEEPSLGSCPNCGAARPPHTVCMNCGMYRGEQVLAVHDESDAG